MTKECATRCGLTIEPSSGVICGVGGTPAVKVLGTASAFLSRHEGFDPLKLSFVVLNKATLELPSYPLPRKNWPHLENLDLADPYFHIPSPVDLILTSGVINQVNLQEVVLSVRGSPEAHRTMLGWVISGSFMDKTNKKVAFGPVQEHIIPSSIDYQQSQNVTSQRKLDSENAEEYSSIETNDTTSSCPVSDVPITENRIRSIPRPQRTNWPRSHIIPSLTQAPSTKKSDDCPVSSPLYVQVYQKALASRVSWPSPTTITLAPVRSSCTLASTPSSSRKPDDIADLAALLETMFRLESVAESPPLTPDELLAEESFRKTLSRKPDGRFSVGLPLAKRPQLLGATRQIAIRRLFQLESRHRRSPAQREPYVNFMKDYLKAGHMEAVPPPQPGQIVYYLPHHPVHREGDPASKIRVVFNASQSSTSGHSLNDILLPGPRLQLDISEVIIRFRQDRFVFTADIRQMFRQIEHRENDRDLLRIVWRFDPNEPVQDYRMTTVTYGTASAPFLAGRVIKEIAEGVEVNHPSVSSILKHRTYVDDINGGADTCTSAKRLRRELETVLAGAQLELRKWASNHPALLEGIPEEHRLPTAESVELNEDDKSELKVLGLRWNPIFDYFHYKPSPVMKIHTKRELARQIGKIFDPLGWLIPVTVFARRIFRVVVRDSFEWDQPLPSNVRKDWSVLAVELPLLGSLQIPRFTPVQNQNLFLVGFADASEKAYAASVYLVSSSSSGNTSRLINARARMAPIKPLTLPRLELCASQLLASLLHKTAPLFPNLDPSHILAYSDSTIALSWITAQPAPVWKTFVGNRVADITRKVPEKQWFHVPSELNPADCASRGIRPTELIENHLWWYGPQWLNSPPSDWHYNRVRPQLTDDNVRSEARNPKHASANPLQIIPGDLKIEELYSGYVLLQSVVAWILRFKHNALTKGHRLKGPLSASERKQADAVLVRRAQSQGLSLELHDTQQRKHKLRITKQLNLFLDSDGILRVGGRLSQANLPYATKHPALLPSDHPTTRLLIDWTHRWGKHVGPLGTLANLRHRYFIVNGKNVVRHRLKKCADCRRVNPKPYQPPMGNLPAERTDAVVPFNITGVDYAGPFYVKSSTLRSSKILECYLCIFLCFSTKAVHIEVATNLSTASFFLAFQSFVALRGLPSAVWSDNGRNFLGAANEIARMRSLLSSTEHQNVIQDAASRLSVDWHFIPPRAPHFGGLWEAAVRSTKRLLHNMLRNEVPEMDVFRAFVAQASAVLNSRPLCSIPSSPDDLAVLTPGHFLAFRPLVAPPMDLSITERSSLKDKWSRAQYLSHQFWLRWKKEYLLDCQARTKWLDHENSPARVGDIVVVIDDNLPPLQWTLGRICGLQPGKDGISRVADVRTSRGVIQRIVRKLCPIVVEDDPEPDTHQDTSTTLSPGTATISEDTPHGGEDV